MTTNNSLQEIKREPWIDWIKTICIYLMVVGHADIFRYESMFFYTFHMPAFFIISGYLYKRHSWIKTLKSFIIPMITFSLFNLLFYLLLLWHNNQEISFSLFEAYIPPLRIKYDSNLYCLYSGFWFVEILFLCRMFLGDINYFSFVQKNKLVISFFLLTILILLPFVFSEEFLIKAYGFRFFSAMILVLFGYWLKNNLENFLKFYKYNYKLIFLLWIIITLHNGSVDMWSGNYGKSILIFISNSIIATTLLIYLTKKLNSNKIVEIFSKGTLLILGVHVPILQILNLYITFNDHGLILPWIKAVLVLLLCYYPIKLSLKFCPKLLGK